MTTGPPLAQSADKSVLFERLGINDQIHKLLLYDGQVARDNLSSNPRNLTDQSRADPSVVEPYKWDEISETAKYEQIRATIRNARPETQPYYSRGQYYTNVSEENWVARWYLWHSFRYRDNRPRSRPATTAHVYQAYSSQPAQGDFYDPARGTYRRH